VLHSYSVPARLLSVTLSIVLAIWPAWSNAGTFNWDPAATNSASGGGTGFWNTTSGLWYNGAGDVPWPNTNADVAVFGGTAGIVTINTGTGVTANGLTFNSGSYIIAGNVAADSLTLAGATPTITVTNNGDTATINAVLAGTVGFTKAGNGTLVLGNNADTFSGDVTISGGTLRVSQSGQLTSGGAVNIANGSTLNVAGNVATNRVITPGTGGGTVSVNSGNTLTLSSALAANGNALTVSGGGTVNLANANNALRSGDVTISGAGTKLSAGVSSTVNPLGTGTINLSGGTLDLSPTANAATTGVSGRFFTGFSVGSSLQFNYTGTATNQTNINTVNYNTTLNNNNNGNPVWPVGTATNFSNTAAEFTAKLNIAAAGNYTFSTNSDDASRLYIDGQLMVLNDGGHGAQTLTSRSLNLSTGLHDIKMFFGNNGGGGLVQLFYASPNNAIPQQVIPQSAMYTAEFASTASATNAIALSNTVNVASGSNSTINLSGTQFTRVDYGSLVAQSGSTLNVTIPGYTSGVSYGKSLGFGQTVFIGGTVGINNQADVYLGKVSDSGLAVTINKTGPGMLVLDNSAAATPSSMIAASVINVQHGNLLLSGMNAGSSPAGSATIRLNGGGLILDTKFNSPTFTNAIDVQQDATLQSWVNLDATLNPTISGAVSIASGKTLNVQLFTADTQANGSSVIFSGGVSGAGNISLTPSVVMGVNGQASASTLRTIFFTNNPSFTGNLTANGGTFQSNIATGSASPAGFGTGTITLNPNSALSTVSGNPTLWVMNNGTGSSGAIAFGNNVIHNPQGGFSTLNLTADRASANTGNTVTFGTLTVNNAGLVGTETLNFTSGNAYSLTFTSTTLAGPGTATLNITGSGTGALNLGPITSPSTLVVNAAAGTTNLGTFSTPTTFSKTGPGLVTLASTNNVTLNGTIGGPLSLGAGVTGLGAANVTVAPAGQLLLNAAANVGGGQAVTVNSSTVSLGMLTLAANFAPPTLTNTLLANTTTGGVFGINTTGYSTALDLSTLGGGAGTMFLGSSGTGSYTAATLTPSGGIYRLGGGGGTLTLSGTPNLLTGANAVLVNDPRLNGSGTIVLDRNQDYTGDTTLITGTLRTTTNAGTGTPFGTGGLNLRGGTLNVAPTGSNAATLTAATAGTAFTFGTTGAIQSGQATVQVNQVSATLATTFTVGNSSFPKTLNFVRNGRATLTFAAPNSINVREQFLVDGFGTSPVNLVNGMAAPYVTISATGATGDFATYNANGFTAANATDGATLDTNFAAPTTSAIESITAATNLATSTNVYAFKQGAVTTTFSANNTILTVSSGGMIFNNTGTTSALAIGTNITGSTVDFGTSEAVIWVASGTGNATISPAITGSGGLTKTGPGRLNLRTSTSTYTGDVVVNQGVLDIDSDARLGAAANNVIVNGGQISFNFGAQYTVARPYLIGPNGGILNLAAAQKVLFSTADTLRGTGMLTRNGQNTLQISVDQPNFSGPWNITAGTVELQTALAAGTGDIYVNGGELAVQTAVPIANTIYANSGTIGGENTSGNPFSGNVVIGGPVNLRMGNFFSTANLNVTLNNLSGNGSLTTISAAGANPSGQILTLTGNSTNFVGTLIVSPGNNVLYRTPSVIPGGTTEIVSGPLGLGGISVGYDAIPTFVNATTSTGGVFGINMNYFTTPIDLSTLGGGTMFLGSSGTGLYAASAITPAAGNIYRIGGGTGTLNLPNGILVGNNSVVIGDSRFNGNGTVQLGGGNTYAGGTTIAGSIAQINSPTALSSGPITITSGGIDTAIAGTTLLKNNPLTWSGSFTYTGTAALNLGTGPVTLTAPLTLTASASTLTVGGNIADAAGANNFTKAGGGTVVLTGTNTYAGTTTISAGTLQFGTGGTSGTIGTGPFVLSGGTLTINHSDNYTIPNQITNTGGGLVTQGANATLLLTNANNALGRVAMSVNGGTIDIGATTATLGIDGGAAVQMNAVGGIGYLNASGGGMLNLVGTGTATNAMDIGATTGGVLVINAKMAGALGIDFHHANGGIVLINGANTYTGRTNVQNAIAVVSSFNSVSGGQPSSSFGAPTTVANGTIGLNGGTNANTAIRYVGAGETTDRVLDLFGTTGGAVVEQAGTGLLKFTSNLTATGVGAKTLTLQGSTTGTGEIAGAIVDNAAGTNNTSLAKNGTGTWTLSGVNTYNGGTTVNNGTLLIDLTTGSLASTTALTLGGGNFALKGKTTGTTTQTVASLNTVVGSSSKITINPNGGTGTTLVIASATLPTAANSYVNFDTSAGTPTTAIVSWSAPLTGTILGPQYTIKDNAGFAYATISAGNVVRLTGQTVLTGTNPNSFATDFLANSSVTNTVVGPALNTLTADTTGGPFTWDLGTQTATLTTGGVLVTGTKNYTISNGTLNGGQATNSAVYLDNSGTGTLTVSANIGAGTGAQTLTKFGAGTVVLSGTNTYTGQTTINTGTLVAAGGSTGAGVLMVGASPGNSVLQVNNGGTMSGSRLVVGNANGANAAVNLVTGGTLNLTQGETTDTDTAFGVANGSYGALNMSGGTYTEQRLQFGGVGGSAGVGAVGVGVVSGGTVNTTGWFILARNAASTGSLTISGGTVNHSGASQDIAIGLSGTGRADLNMTGGLLNNTGRRIDFSGGTGGTFTWTGTGTLNLNGGTTLTNAIFYGSGSAFVNFNGGTLKAAATNATFMSAITTGNAYINGPFGAFAGNANIDTNGFNITVSANLTAPTGNGLTNIAVTSAGSGYIGAPYVSILGAGLDATAIANMVDDGTGNGTLKVQSITVINPGVNYSGTPIVTLVGGGASTPATVGAVTLGANTAGTLNKLGTGILTLSGNNTYNMPTNVVGGSLALGSGGQFAASQLLSSSGRFLFENAGGNYLLDSLTSAPKVAAQLNGTASGAVVVNTATAGVNADFTANGWNLSNGFLGATGNVTYTGTVTPMAGNYRLGGGGGVLTFNQNITGNSTLTIGSGTGTVLLGGTNTFTGGTTLATGTLQLASASALNNFGNGAVVSNGGTIQWTGSNLDLSSVPGGLVLSSGTTTFDVGGGWININSTIRGAGALTKTNIGVLQFNTPQAYTGATTISAGSIRLGETNALRSSAVTVSVANGLAFAPGIGTFQIGSLAGASGVALTDNLGNAVTLSAGRNNTSTSYTGVLSGTGGLTVYGTGTLTLANNGGQTYTGATTIAGSTQTAANGGLLLDFSNATFTSLATNPVSASSALVLGGNTYAGAGGGTLTVKGKASATDSQTFNGTTLNQGDSYVVVTQNTASQITLNLGTLTRNTGSGVHFFLPTAGAVNATATLTNGILGGWAVVDGTTAGTASDYATLNSGTVIPYINYLTASSPSTLTSDATVNYKLSTGSGAFTFGAAAGDKTDVHTINYSDSVANGSITAGNAASILRFGAAGGILIGNTKALTIGGTANSGVVTAGGADNTNGELIINTGANAATTGMLTINSVIANNGTGVVTVTKNGNSQLTLAGTNTYTGGTNVNAGRVAVTNNTAAFGTVGAGGAGDVYIKNSGQVYLTGGTWSNNWFLSGTGTSENTAFGAIRIDGTSTLSGTITLVTDAQIGTNNGIAVGPTLSGKITGPGALSRIGNGTVGLSTLIISNATNDYAGGTSISGAAAVQFNSAAAMGSGNITLAGLSTLALNFTGVQAVLNTRLNPAPSGIIALTTTSAGENIDFSVTGANQAGLYFGSVTGQTFTYTGTYTPNGTTYRLMSNGGTITYGTNAFTGNRSLTIGGTITGGTHNLASNNYTGGTTLASNTAVFTDVTNFGTGGIAMTGGQLRWAASYAGGDLSTRTLSLVSGTTQLDTNGNNIVLANSIGNGGAALLQKNGTGSLTLSGANSAAYGWTGGITINAGSVVLNNAAAIYPTAPVVFNNVAGLSLQLNNSLTIGSLASGGGGANGGTLNLNGNTLTLGLSNAGTTFAGTFSGAGALVKTGVGSLAFTPSAAAAGVTSVTINGGEIYTDFSNANTAPQTNPFAATSTLTLAGGGLRYNGKASTTNSQTFASTTLNAGQAQISLTNNATANPLSVTLGTITRNAGSTLNFVLPANGAVAPDNGIILSNTNTDYTAQGGANTILGGWATVANTDWASVSGGQIQPLTGYNGAYVAGADVDSGLGVNAPGAVTVNSLRFNFAGAASVDATGGFVVASGGILVTPTVAANAISFDNGTLSSGAGQSLIFLQNGPTTSTLTVNSQIIGNRPIVKSGAGPLTLTNTTNAYSDLYINGGIVTLNAQGTQGSGNIILGADNNSGIITRLTITAGMNLSNPISLNNVFGVAGIGVINAQGTGTATLSGPITINGVSNAGGTFSAQANSVLQLNGPITAPLGVPVTSRLGTVVFAGGGTYYSLVHSADTLRLGANNGLSPSAILQLAVSAAGTFDLNGFNQTLAGMSGAGFAVSIINNGTPATLTLNPAATQNLVVNTNVTITGNLTLAMGATAAGTETIQGTMIQNNGVSVAGGTLILSGTNSYNGGNTVTGGSLVMGSTTALGSTTNSLTMSGGTVDINGQGGLTVALLSGSGGTITDTATTPGGAAFSTASDSNSTFGGVIADGTNRKLSFTKDGAGILTLTGTNTYSGSTYVAGGTLNTTTLTNGSTTTVAANAKLNVDQIVQSSLTLLGSSTSNTGVTTIRASGTNAVGDNTKVNRVGNLAIANDGAALGTRTYQATLDLKNNDLIIDNSNAAADNTANSLLANVTDMLRSGAASGWTGKGLTSSYVATQAPSLATSLGVIRNVYNPVLVSGGGNTPLYTTFDNQTLTGNEVLVKYTWTGDSNLDGQISALDYALLDAGMAATLQADGKAGWYFGDFNYSGTVDNADKLLLDSGLNAFRTGGGVPAIGGSTQLPEPSTFLLGALGGLALLTLRRRRSQN